ncbi:MAG: hypothetical protein JXA71_13005 [Chitinispirillaceae bacterium]|nr:hypothetical protein [Chitinispirillaceae bacterium]
MNNIPHSVGFVKNKSGCFWLLVHALEKMFFYAVLNESGKNEDAQHAGALPIIIMQVHHTLSYLRNGVLGEEGTLLVR